MTAIALKFDKAARVLRKRGPAALAAFVFGRLVARRVSRVVYEIDLRSAAPPAGPDASVSIVGPDNRDTVSRELRAFLGGDAAEEYLSGLVKGDRLFVLENQGAYAHFGWILFHTRQIRLIGEKRGTPLIANCYTAPFARGHGLYRRALESEAAWLRERGYSRAVVETAVDNYASRKGIESAGFRLAREMQGWILFNSLCVQTIIAAGRRSRRIWIG